MSFNFEISLINILCKDEVNLIKQEDYRRSKKIVKKNRNNCSWKGYQDIKDGFEEWLFDWCEIPGDFIDNLDACVYWYNRESFEGKTIKDYFKDRELKILPKYRKYLDEED